MPGSDSGSQSIPEGAREFRTTHWSVVLGAADSAAPGAAEALEKLCRAYWYPLYAYVRREGYGPDDAQDLTQGFFARFLEKNYLAQVNREKGRFRSFLLASLRHFLADERDRAQALKRGGGQIFISRDAEEAEQRYQQEPADKSSPESIYERRWALTVLDRAQAKLKAEFTADGKSDLYEALKIFLSGEKPEQTHAQLAARLGKSTDAVRCAVQRLRQRYGELIRAEVSDTVSSAGQIDEEIRYLLQVIGG
jgi:RNA polymerase sigma-70 factor (ECF subfamily)